MPTNVMGKMRYVAPIAMALFMALMMSCMFYPMANMQMKGLPFAILSLDEGVDANGTEMNVGDTIVDSMLESSEDDDDATIVWKEVDSQEELDEALEDGEYYGALVIPADYSEKQLAATQAEQEEMLEEAQALMAQQEAAAAAAAAGTTDASAAAAGTTSGASAADTQSSAATVADSSDDEEVETPTLTMILDNAKSPLIATQMSTSISSMFQEMGMEVETETIHTLSSSEGDDDSSSSTAMGTMASLMLGIMPPFMLSMIASNFIVMGFRASASASRRDRWKAFGKEAVFALALSFVVSLLASLMMWAVADISVPMGSFIPFIWLTSFCMMMVFIGLGNIALPLGMIGGMLIMMLGMMSGTLPYECLPTFWQDWIYPWAPPHYISEGIRAILYMDAGAWNSGTLPLIICGLIGIAFSIIGMLIPRKQRNLPDGTPGQQGTPDSQSKDGSQDTPAPTAPATA